MPLQDDNDVETVIDTAAEAAATAAAAEAEDRGDDFNPEPEEQEAAPAVEPEAAKAVLERAAEEDPSPMGIPKARFNEVNEERKRLARENEELRIRAAQLEARQAPAQAQPEAPAAKPEPFDEDAKEEAYVQALLEGDTGKARAIRKEINAYLRDSAVQQAETASATRREAEARNAEQSTLAQVSAQAVKDYPYLDTPEGADALEIIVAARDAGIAKGLKPSAALKAAVDKFAAKFAPAAPAEEPDATTSLTKVDNRDTEAVKRGAKALGQQPPNVQAGIGNRASAARIDPSKLTDAEFAKLSDEDRRRLRGDIV